MYDFLKAEGVIGVSVYDSAIAIASDFKALMLKNWADPLWRFSFIHCWGKPNYQTDEDFAKEVQRFANTIEDAKPLSTEPTELPDWDKMLTDVAETMAKKISANAGVGSPATSVSSQPAQPEANCKSPKTSKPKKSPLKEAKALNKAKSGNKKKKKKRKGFR